MDFAEMLELEHIVQTATALEMFGETFAMRERGAKLAFLARQELYAAVDALTDEQALAYGTYRRANR